MSKPLTTAVPEVGGMQRGHHPDQRRLAGAVRTEQAEDLAGLDLEADALDGGEIAEAS